MYLDQADGFQVQRLQAVLKFNFVVRIESIFSKPP
jgi:hypothetical protein